MNIRLTHKSSLEESLQDGECSPSKLLHSSGMGMTPYLLQKYKNVQFNYINLANILSRPHSLRSHSENKFLSQFASQNAALKQLSEFIGLDFSKGILRTATLQQYNAQQIIESKGSFIQRFYIILEGRLGMVKNEDESDMQENIPKKEIFEQLMGLARREIKKMSKITRKLSSFRQDHEIHHVLYQQYEKAQFVDYFEHRTTFGGKALISGNTYSHTTVAVEDSLLMTVDVKNLIYWLNHCFQQKLEASFGLLRGHSCFINLPNETLESIVEILWTEKAHKGDIIYEQGSPTTYIYFLQEGQIKIQKISNLFVENPNELYVNRRTLMNQKELTNRQYLAYADLHLLYNYTPTSKTLDLGILTPGCLFGEQQILDQKPRQTTTRCISFKSTYFKIELRRLYQILGEKTSLFLASIRDSMRDKVKYRQKVYAATINLENRNNLKYFYEGESVTQRKKIISKINSKISEGKALNDGKTKSANEIQKMSKTLQLKHQIQPSYNAFNFHRMLKTKLKGLPHPESSSSEEDAVQLKHRQKQEAEREMKIVNDSHTWRLVKEKVQRQTKLGRKLGTHKYRINFRTPLIDDKYFSGIDKEMKRLEREERLGKFSISSSRVESKNKSKSLLINITVR